MSSEAFLDALTFPQLPEAVARRTLYFERASILDKEAMKGRGYEAVSLFELPRTTPEEDIAYLMAKVQGIEEGTVRCSDAQLKALELEMKAYNLISQKHVVARFDMKEKQKGKSVQEVLSTWGASRHTLRGNSTVVNMQLPDLNRKELVSGQGKRPKGDTAREKQKKGKGQRR